MTYDPRTPAPPPERGPRESYTGFVLIAILAVLAIVFVVWLLGNDGDNGEPSGDTNPVVTTTVPDDTTLPDGTTTAP